MSDRVRLLELCEQEVRDARASLPENAAAPVRRITTFADVPRPSDLPAVRTEWLVEGVVARNSVTMLAGESGVGKTWFALCLALAVTFGRPFLNVACRHSPVLYLDRENPWAVVRERLVVLGAVPEKPDASGGELPLPDSFRYWGGSEADPPPLLGDPRLLAMAREVRPLIVVDSMIRFHEQDENSASAMSAVMNAIKSLAFAGASVLVLHHKPKNSDSLYRGSTDIMAGVEMMFSLAKKAESDTLRLACSKSRSKPLEPVLLRPAFDSRGGYELADPATEAIAAEREEDAAHAEKLLQLIVDEPGLAQRQLAERSGLPVKRVYALLHRLEGKLWRVEVGARAARCYYPVNSDAS